MEVHNHTHTSRKKWTHYLWEFIMLFLAVFCGFLAENIREHQVEKHRGQQYVLSLYEDLKNDTTAFNTIIRVYSIKLKALENRKRCYDSLRSGSPCTDCLENLEINSTHFPDLAYTDRTIQQLKSAGGLRLIPKSDADSILQYDNMLRSYQTTEKTSFQEIQTGLRSTLYSLLNYDRGHGKQGGSYFFENNPDLINRYFNQLDTYSFGTRQNLEDMKQILEMARALINYFKDKYHYK